jgi:hypothetical protein
MKHIIGSDGTLVEMTDLMVYINWKNSFYADIDGKYTHLRLGQAFLNELYPGVVMSSLFYEEDASVAETIIYQTFIYVNAV